MILADEPDTASLGELLARKLRSGDVVTLSGPLGVGKTALARSVLKGLGHEGEVPSPTFAIVQPYEALDPPVWHVDLYRIEMPEDLEELGLDEGADGVLLIEWPERAGPNAFGDALRLTLDFGRNGERILTATVPPSWQERWPPR
jgi:tRNA threonylcarbamoyladenosine biosynthesis protein TsaE